MPIDFTWLDKLVYRGITTPDGKQFRDKVVQLGFTFVDEPSPFDEEERESCEKETLKEDSP